MAGTSALGMMIFDEFRPLDFLAGRPEVDPSRLGAFGMSMGSTKTWWLAALDPVCIWQSTFAASPISNRSFRLTI